MQSLVQGANAPLPQEDVRVILTWSGDADLDADATAFVVGANGRVRSDDDMVFWNQLSAEDGAVALTLGSKSAACAVALGRLPLTVAKVLVCLSCDQTRLATIAPGLVEVVNAAGQPLARFDPALGEAAERAMILVELYRRGDDWKVRAVGQGFLGGGLGPLARSFGVDVEE